jgi:predicted  nucleic acid-binding Zn-ribbon protein
MDEQTNQFNDDDDRVSRILEQWEIDENYMKDLSEANRFYCKCVAGKCPPPFDRKQKFAKKPPQPVKKPKNFVSSKLQDKKLAKIWVEKGRARRIKLLENELNKVRLQIAVATAKTHIEEQEKNFKGIAHLIEKMDEMDERINKAKSEIAHLKSQIVRVDQKKQELSRETESEGEIDG